MTICALAGIVVHRFVLTMAGLAICETGVIEDSDTPIRNIGVAANAFAGIMVSRFILGVADGTFLDAGMIKSGRFPVGRIGMAGNAFTREVVNRLILLDERHPFLPRRFVQR